MEFSSVIMTLSSVIMTLFILTEYKLMDFASKKENLLHPPPAAFWFVRSLYLKWSKVFITCYIVGHICPIHRWLLFSEEWCLCAIWRVFTCRCGLGSISDMFMFWERNTWIGSRHIMFCWYCSVRLSVIKISVWQCASTCMQMLVSISV